MAADKPFHGANHDARESTEKAKAKNMGVAFFETQQTAVANMEELKSRATRFDQLNIVVREEVKNLDSNLETIGRVYCGAVWWQVHEQRVTEGFYKE